MPGGSGKIIADTRIPTKYAVAVRFGILSDKEVEQMSVQKITNDQNFDPRTKLPTNDGVNSLKLGTMDRKLPCYTCDCDYNDCPGHFGSIPLAEPVFHPGYLTNIHKVLRCVCFECGALKLRDPRIRKAIMNK